MNQIPNKTGDSSGSQSVSNAKLDSVLPEVSLPMYINENGKKYWLTITADIKGEWNIGYSTDGSTYLKWSAIGENSTIDEALSKLAAHYHEYRQTN